MEQLRTSCPALDSVLPKLSVDEVGVLQELCEAYAETPEALTALAAQWDTVAQSLNEDHVLQRFQSFCNSILHFNATYDGGLKSYVTKARVLLQRSKVQCVPSL